MRVAENDGVQVFAGEEVQLREAVSALVLGVGAAIEDDTAIASLKKVAVGADFDLACEIGETKVRHENREATGRGGI